MNGKDLFTGLSYIDERFIDEAENAALTKRSLSPWLRAACLLLIFLGLWRLQPFFPVSPGPVPSTAPTDEPILPEGFSAVFLDVVRMTEDGFTGRIIDYSGADLFEIGTELHVAITEDTMYVTDDGRLESVAEAGFDYTGCLVFVEFAEFSEDAAAITAHFITVEQEATP